MEISTPVSVDAFGLPEGWMRHHENLVKNDAFWAADDGVCAKQ